jgi:hypothetical protein
MELVHRLQRPVQRTRCNPGVNPMTMRADLMRRGAEPRAITGALRETFDRLRTENEAPRRRSRAPRDRLGQEADAGSPRPTNSTARPLQVREPRQQRH